MYWGNKTSFRGIEWFFKFWPDHEISEVFVSKSFFGVILHLGVSNFFKSQCQSLKSGSRSLAVSNSPLYTPSFALFRFSISRLAFFMSEIIVILNTCSYWQKTCCVNYTTEHQRKLKSMFSL